MSRGRPSRATVDLALPPPLSRLQTGVERQPAEISDACFVFRSCSSALVRTAGLPADVAEQKKQVCLHRFIECPIRAAGRALRR